MIALLSIVTAILILDSTGIFHRIGWVGFFIGIPIGALAFPLDNRLFYRRWYRRELKRHAKDSRNLHR